MIITNINSENKHIAYWCTGSWLYNDDMKNKDITIICDDRKSIKIAKEISIGFDNCEITDKKYDITHDAGSYWNGSEFVKAKNKKHVMYDVMSHYGWKENKIFDTNMLSKIQIDFNYYCNLQCPQCSRNCNLLKSSDELSIKQMQRFLNEINETNWNLRRCDILGGEPTWHPDVELLLELFYTLKERGTQLRFYTNGSSARAKQIISNIPSFVKIKNSHRGEGQKYCHTKYHIAPCDVGIKEMVMCEVPWFCGMSFNMHGYFGCGTGAVIAKTFGFDIGIKKLSDVTADKLRNQFRQFCKYCGLARSTAYCRGNIEEMSKSWACAINQYKDGLISRY